LLHPQRHMGTLMCHRGHRSDGNPLQDVGEKDITAHVNFSAIALAGQDAGLDVLGYTSQGRFLLNCGLAQDLAEASPRLRSRAQMLMAEHEMGELFKVLLFGKDLPVMNPLGFVHGDRTHRL
jgi:SAM-dependent MidA family methyltransferase